MRGSWTKWIWLAASLVLLIGASSLRGPIEGAVRSNFQTQLSQQIARENPDYMLLTTAPGVLRAPFIGYLWMTAEEMKEEGRVFDLWQRSNMICKLQPRFAGAWAFHAWNMAYNIVAQSNTNRERWQWIKNGIETLRDRGIEYNPTSLTLHRELAWTFFHKIGGFSDDNHWYYKRRWAGEMQHLLAPPGYTTSENAIADFRPIAEAPLDRETPVPESAVPWIPLTVAIVAVTGALVLLATPRFHSKPGMVAALGLLIVAGGVFAAAMAFGDPDTAALAAEYATARDRLRADANVAEYVDRLAAAGLDLDRSLLEAYNTYSEDARLRIAGFPEPDPNANPGVYALINAPGDAEPRRKALAFTRAQILFHEYKMDPQRMLELMETYGPLDWRLPWPHSLYWSLKGIEAVEGTQVDTLSNINLLNMTRVTLNSMKNLTWNGRVMYTEDPQAPELPMLSMHLDPRFVPEMLKLYDQFSRRAEKERDEVDWENTYRAGHINYLAGVMNALYALYERDLAERIYDYIKDRYKPEGPEYQLPLKEFVLYRINREGRPIRKHAVAQITAAVRAALLMHLGGRRDDAAESFEYAATVWQVYQREAVGAYPLEPLALFVANELGTLLVSPKAVGVDYLDLRLRSRLYNDSAIDNRVRQIIYDGIKGPLRDQCRAAGVDFDKAFPEPEGMAEFRRQMRALSDTESPVAE